MPTLEQLLTPETREYFGIDTATVRTRLARMIIQDHEFTGVRSPKLVDLAERNLIRRHIAEHPVPLVSDEARERVNKTIAIERYNEGESSLRTHAKELAIASLAIADDLVGTPGWSPVHREEIMDRARVCVDAMVWIGAHTPEDAARIATSAVENTVPPQEQAALVPVHVAHPMPV